MPEIALVNGRFSEIADAVVSIEDRGFQFADGVYEVVIAYGDKPFMMTEHLDRLKASLKAIDMEFDIDAYGLKERLLDGVGKAGFDQTMIYVQITRGTAPRSHAYDPAMKPTVIATFKAKPIIPQTKRDAGLSVITVQDIRWPKCFIKSIALLPNILVKNDAIRRGYDDALFVSPDGYVREATAANVFTVRDGALITPPTDDAILHGVTRKYILQCAKRINLPVHEEHLRESNLSGADEAFLSSTTLDIAGMTRLNDKPIASGQVGPITKALYKEFTKGLHHPQPNAKTCA